MCTKKSYRSISQVEAVLRAIAAIGDPRRRENGAHPCESCGALHLTSRASGKWLFESSTGRLRGTYPENGSSI